MAEDGRRADVRANEALAPNAPSAPKSGWQARTAPAVGDPNRGDVGA